MGYWVLNCGIVPIGVFKSREVMIVSAMLTFPFLEIVEKDDHTVYFRYDFCRGQRVLLMEEGHDLVRR